MALIEATAEVLRAGGEVQIKEVAATAGVSHTLVYRHFPDGGKDEMIAEAHSHLFRGLAETDIAELLEILETNGADRTAIHSFALRVLSPRRTATRWSRLEALAQARTNAYISDRIEEVRSGLIRSFADRLMVLQPNLPKDAATALSIVTQALPLGITAISGADMTKRVREVVAGMWTDLFIRELTDADADADA
jgi:AcrR family transcriptional regulator